MKKIISVLVVLSMAFTISAQMTEQMLLDDIKAYRTMGVAGVITAVIGSLGAVVGGVIYTSIDPMYITPVKVTGVISIVGGVSIAAVGAVFTVFGIAKVRVFRNALSKAN